MNLLAHFFRPKTSVHIVPRFHAATRAERRKARTLSDDRRDELEGLKAGLSDEDRKAAIARASMRTDKQREGRA